MLATVRKQRPTHVPEENVYDKTHWLVVITYLIAAFAVYLLISSAG